MEPTSATSEPTLEIIHKPDRGKTGLDGLPLPPVDLTMGYGGGDMDQYFASGKRSYEALAGMLKQQRVVLKKGDAVLDWGCSSGRALRHFIAEAERGCKMWGGDINRPSIEWARNNLSPPFKFFNSCQYPHLPFPDHTFRFIYGLSVMTHLNSMRDLWLLELRRILSPGGCLILTIHNEDTWEIFKRGLWPSWLPDELKQYEELPGECIEIRGSSWEHCYTFFGSDYIRRIWGQYFHIENIIPGAEDYQTAVVMRNRERALIRRRPFFSLFS